MGNKVSLVLCHVVFSFPWSISFIFVKPFFTLFVGLQVLEMFVTARVLSFAYIRSWDHYVSFFLAPTTAKGPRVVMLAFRIWGSFYLSIHLLTSGFFLYWTGKAPFLDPVFGSGEQVLFLRVPVGLCYAHPPFQKHLLFEPGWRGGVLCKFSGSILGLWSLKESDWISSLFSLQLWIFMRILSQFILWLVQ